MPDDSSGFFSNLRSYANEYVETKRRNLQAKPQTQVEGAGTDRSVSFAGQDISQSELRDVKQMRESGGIISQVFHSKALIKFGTGAELQAEDDSLEEWLQENVGPVDDVVLDLGEDSLWYPYGLGEVVETQGGKFSHIELIEPWTMLPETDEFGDIVLWRQHLKGDFNNLPTFQPDEIGSIIINKSSGRDKTGISEALRSQEEIETFRANQQAMREATERIGFPFVHAKAGREGATQLNDNELRRIRNRLAQIGPGETQVTGPDVDIDLKDPATVDFGAIQERDMRMLATSLGVPVELLNHGSDGLGSGMPAELRKDLLALQNEADRRRFSEQFVEEFLRPIVRQYSPFDHTMEMHVEFEPFLDDKTDMASLISSVGEYMTANEAREKMGLSKLDDEEKGEAFQTPAEQEKDPEEQGGGLFGSAPSDTDFRDLAEGYPISDRSECDGQVVEGPQGGLRCIPSGGGEDGGDSAAGEITERAKDDGTIDVDDLEPGDVVEDADGTFGEMQIQGVGTDETGTVVQFEANGEDYFIYEDMLADLVVPGAEVDSEGEESTTEPDSDGDDGGDDGYEVGQTVTFDDGREATVDGYDPDTDVVAVTDENGEEWFQTGDAFRDEPEPEPDPKNERVRDAVGLPDNTSVDLADLDDDRVDSVIQGLQTVEESLGIEEGDIFNLTTTPPEDVGGNAAAAFHTGNRTLYVNPDAATGDDRRAEYEAGFLSTPDQQGNVMHEMIHSKHSSKALTGDGPSLDELREDNFDSEQKSMIREEVSDYAAVNGMEFVGEVGAGLLSGEQYSDSVIELYSELGGPEVAQ